MLTPDISPGVLRRVSSTIIVLSKCAVEKCVYWPCMFSMVTDCLASGGKLSIGHFLTVKTMQIDTWKCFVATVCKSTQSSLEMTSETTHWFVG